MKGVPFEVETPEQVKKDVAWLADKKVDLVKIWVDDHFGKERKIPMDLSKAIIEEAHKHGLKVVGSHLLSGRCEGADGTRARCARAQYSRQTGRRRDHCADEDRKASGSRRRR